MKLPFHIAILIAAAIAVALLADAWRSARHDSQQLAATLAAQNAAIREAGDQEKQRDTQLASALSAIQAQKRAVRTPEQAAKELPSVLPDLPLPLSVHDPDLTIPPAPGETPSTTISVPQPDLVPLYDSLQDCRACATENATLKSDLADEKARSAALLHERDAAIKAARGGSFLQRVERAAKWFALGAAVGAAAAAAHR